MAEIDDLKAAFAQVIEALSARNADAVATLLHEEVVAFSHLAPFPVNGKASFHQALRQAFMYRESETVAPVNPQFRVIGGTGLAWGHTVVTKKPKDGPWTTEYLRYLWTFVKTEGGWLVAAVHNSRLPSGG